jgi:hypothetical protein
MKFHLRSFEDKTPGFNHSDMTYRISNDRQNIQKGPDRLRGTNRPGRLQKRNLSIAHAGNHQADSTQELRKQYNMTRGLLGYQPNPHHEGERINAQSFVFKRRKEQELVTYMAV